MPKQAMALIREQQLKHETYTLCSAVRQSASCNATGTAAYADIPPVEGTCVGSGLAAGDWHCRFWIRLAAQRGWTQKGR